MRQEKGVKLHLVLHRRVMFEICLICTDGTMGKSGRVLPPCGDVTAIQIHLLCRGVMCCYYQMLLHFLLVLLLHIPSFSSRTTSICFKKKYREGRFHLLFSRILKNNDVAGWGEGTVAKGEVEMICTVKSRYNDCYTVVNRRTYRYICT